MKLRLAHFIKPVSFGGMLSSASRVVVGDKIGQEPMEIELDEKQRFVTLTKKVNGVLDNCIVPIQNISAFFYLTPEPAPAKK